MQQVDSHVLGIERPVDGVALGVFLAATLAIMVTPGPDMLFVLARTLSYGRRAGLVSVLGIATSILVHTLLAAFGLSRLLAAYPTAFIVLRFVGAAYLLFLAYKTWRDAPHAIERAHAERPPPSLRIWRDAFLTNLLNPKALVFFVAFLPQFATGGTDAFRQMVLLGALVALVSAAVNSLVCVTAATAGRALAESPRVVNSRRWVGAGVLAALAVRILV